jgi:hypothetical protein
MCVGVCNTLPAGPRAASPTSAGRAAPSALAACPQLRCRSTVTRATAATPARPDRARIYLASCHSQRMLGLNLCLCAHRARDGARLLPAARDHAQLHDHAGCGQSEDRHHSCWVVALIHHLSILSVVSRLLLHPAERDAVLSKAAAPPVASTAASSSTVLLDRRSPRPAAHRSACACLRPACLVASHPPAGLQQASAGTLPASPQVRVRRRARLWRRAAGGRSTAPLLHAGSAAAAMLHPAMAGSDACTLMLDNAAAGFLCLAATVHRTTAPADHFGRAAQRSSGASVWLQGDALWVHAPTVSARWRPPAATKLSGPTSCPAAACHRRASCVASSGVNAGSTSGCWVAALRFTLPLPPAVRSQSCIPAAAKARHVRPPLFGPRARPHSPRPRIGAMGATRLDDKSAAAHAAAAPPKAQGAGRRWPPSGRVNAGAAGPRRTGGRWRLAPSSTGFAPAASSGAPKLGPPAAARDPQGRAARAAGPEALVPQDAG